MGACARIGGGSGKVVSKLFGMQKRLNREKSKKTRAENAKSLKGSFDVEKNRCGGNLNNEMNTEKNHAAARKTKSRMQNVR